MKKVTTIVLIIGLIWWLMRSKKETATQPQQPAGTTGLFTGVYSGSLIRSTPPPDVPVINSNSTLNSTTTTNNGTSLSVATSNGTQQPATPSNGDPVASKGEIQQMINFSKKLNHQSTFR